MFPRDLVNELEEYIQTRQALFILGARQTGKTTLLKLLMEKLPDQQCIYLDLEKSSDRRLIEEGEEGFLRFLRLSGLDMNRKNYVFIDEIQYYPEFSSLIKLLVDHHSDSVKLILSGSSAAQIRLRFKDSLAGRKFVFYLYPLTFREFLIFKGKEKWADLLNLPFFSLESDDLKFFRTELLKLLEEFILYGGFPEVVKTDNLHIKEKILREILDAYVIKDIRGIFQIGDIDRFNHLAQYLAVVNGSLLSVTNISNRVGLPRRTVERYLTILKDTFIIQSLSPYFGNRAKELKKTPKIYFLDSGLRNTLCESYTSLGLRSDAGMLFENYVFTQLWKNKALNESLYFWRTRNKQEVDFVVKQGEELYPIEVKTSGGKLSHLKKFMNEYDCDLGYVVSFKQEYEQSGNITVLPGYLV